MPQNQSALDFEKLREFELRMHYEGVAAFAAGPSPWESWDDAGAMGTWQRLEDTPLHPVRRPSHPGMGQRMLNGLARLLILMLLVGIGGVYLSTVSEAPVVATGITPAPIVVARTARTVITTATQPADTLADELSALPAPAAGDNPWPAQTDPAQEIPPPWANQDAFESTEIPAPEQSLPEDVAPVATIAQEQPLPEAAIPVVAITPEPSQTTATAPAPDTTQSPAAPDTLETAALPVQGDASPDFATPATDALPESPAPAPAAQVTLLEETVPPPAPMEPASAALDAVPPPAQENLPPEGEWVVNLASYNRVSTAQRMLAKFKDKGVAAEIVTITVKDKPMVRIRTTGYQSASEARDWVALLEERLGLEGVWISKR
jgi:hypothetical protein